MLDNPIIVYDVIKEYINDAHMFVDAYNKIVPLLLLNNKSYDHITQSKLVGTCLQDFPMDYECTNYDSVISLVKYVDHSYTSSHAKKINEVFPSTVKLKVHADDEFLECISDKNWLPDLNILHVCGADDTDKLIKCIIERINDKKLTELSIPNISQSLLKDLLLAIPSSKISVLEITINIDDKFNYEEFYNMIKPVLNLAHFKNLHFKDTDIDNRKLTGMFIKDRLFKLSSKIF